MDYEKKYKEAIKRAKHYKEGITDRKLEKDEKYKYSFRKSSGLYIYRPELFQVFIAFFMPSW